MYEWVAHGVSVRSKDLTEGLRKDPVSSTTVISGWDDHPQSVSLRGLGSIVVGTVQLSNKL